MFEKKPPVKREKCGSVAGYRAHSRRGEESCQPCRDAITAYNKKSKMMRDAGIIALKPTAEEMRRDALANAEKDLEGIYSRKSRPTMPEGMPDYPAYLKYRGSMLWYDTLTRYSLSPQALEVLTEVCRQVDQLDRISAILASKKTLWFELGEPDDDGQMQIVINAAIGEAKTLSASISKLMRDLGILEKAKPVEQEVSKLAAFRAGGGGTRAGRRGVA